MNNKNTTHTVRYEQPGVMAALPFNKAAQFGLGLVILAVGWKAFTAGWFSDFAFRQMGQPQPTEGLGTPVGLLPFLIDAVCLVGLAGFAVAGLIRGAIGPLFGGVSEWMAGVTAAAHGERAAASVAESLGTGMRTTSGREITQAEAIKCLFDRIKRLEAKTADLPEPEPPPRPKTAEELLADQAEMMAEMQKMQKRLDEIDKKPATRTKTRTAKAKS
ncbi:MAG: hypothetical protein ACF788_01260 [Novipirellula sp. JB048]